MSDGLSDHDLLIEVRKDVKWIKEHLGQFPPRKEVYGVMGFLISAGLAIWIL